MARRRLPSPEHADTLSLNALRSLVTGLLERAEQAEVRLAKLETENGALREENAELRLENTRLKAENQLLRDEIARLKNLPPRPPFRPSGMEQATNGANDKSAGKKKPRGPKLDAERVSREEILRASVPAGSRFKGYKSCLVRDLVLAAELVHYRRECWITPDGKTVTAPLPAGIMGSYGPNLRRLCLMLHAQGQVTTGRLTTLLNDVGIAISKRQVVRLLTKGLDGFVAEDSAVLHAGLVSSSYVTVDDTGARHARGNSHTTQIGGEYFTVFRTSASKSRLNFLSLLRGNYKDYVLNAAALDYLAERRADPTLIAKLRTIEPQRFCNEVPFLEYRAKCKWGKIGGTSHSAPTRSFLFIARTISSTIVLSLVEQIGPIGIVDSAKPFAFGILSEHIGRAPHERDRHAIRAGRIKNGLGQNKGHIRLLLRPEDRKSKTRLTGRVASGNQKRTNPPFKEWRE